MKTQIAMLIEHLKADDINLRVTATRSLPAIADALGPDRVRAELVPFINDSTDDEDEVLSRRECHCWCGWATIFNGMGWDGVDVESCSM